MGLAAISEITRHDLLSVMYLGVIQLGLSYVLFTIGMTRGVRSLDAGIVCYIEPALNPVWVFLVLGERLALGLLGSAIIMRVIIHMLFDAHSKRRLRTRSRLVDPCYATLQQPIPAAVVITWRPVRITFLVNVIAGKQFLVSSIRGAQRFVRDGARWSSIFVILRDEKRQS